MLTLAVVTLLTAEPAATIAAPGPAAPTTHAIVSTYPLALAGATLLLAATDGNAAVYAPFAVQVPIRSDLSFDLELAFGYHTPTSFGTPGWSVTVAAGPTWFPFSGERVLGGFYVGPRFQVQVVEAAKKIFFFAGAGGGGSGPIDAGPGIRRSFLVGAELGWQFRVGRWVFGPVLGASVGYSFEARTALALPFESGIANFGNGQGTDTFALGFDLNVFKLGCAF